MGRTIAQKVNIQYEILSNKNIVLEKDYKEAVFPQSILGMAHEGHGVFRSYPIRTLSLEKILEYLKFDVHEKKDFRFRAIQNLIGFFDEIIDGRKNRFTDKNGFPIFGVSFLEEIRVRDAKSACKGVIMGLVDSAYWRAKTLLNFPFNFEGKSLEIGYGREFLFDFEKMTEENLNEFNLSKKEYSFDFIENCRKKGLIVDSNSNSRNFYVRLKKGLGCCDDACLASIGKFYGEDAFWTGFCIDASDTYTKFVSKSIEGGWDEWISNYVIKKWKEKYKEDLLEDFEIMKIIYLGAKQNSPFIKISSSHRRFCEVEKKQFQPTIMNHRDFFVSENIPSRHQLGFERLDSFLGLTPQLCCDKLNR